MSKPTLQNRGGWPQIIDGISPHRGPFDTKNYVFLGRAVERVGQAVFGDDWPGWEADDWDDFLENYTPEQEEHNRRFHRVKELITEACGSGELLSAIRQLDGDKAEMKEMPCHWWELQTDRLGIFAICCISPEDFLETNG
jgi:hypothetical protein